MLPLDWFLCSLEHSSAATISDRVYKGQNNVREHQNMTKMTNSTRKSGSTFAVTGIKRSEKSETLAKSKIFVKKIEKIFKKLNPSKKEIEDKLEAQQSRIAELEAEVKRLNKQNRQTNKRIFEQNAPKSTSKIRSSQIELTTGNRRISAEFSRNIKIQRKCDFSQSTSRIHNVSLGVNHEQVNIKGLEMGWQLPRNVNVGYGMATHPPRRLNSSVVRRSPTRRDSEINFSILL